MRLGALYITLDIIGYFSEKPWYKTLYKQTWIRYYKPLAIGLLQFEIKMHPTEAGRLIVKWKSKAKGILGEIVGKLKNCQNIMTKKKTFVISTSSEQKEKTHKQTTYPLYSWIVWIPEMITITNTCWAIWSMILVCCPRRTFLSSSVNDIFNMVL